MQAPAPGRSGTLHEIYTFLCAEDGNDACCAYDIVVVKFSLTQLMLTQTCGSSLASGHPRSRFQCCKPINVGKSPAKHRKPLKGLLMVIETNPAGLGLAAYMSFLNSSLYSSRSVRDQACYAGDGCVQITTELAIQLLKVDRKLCSTSQYSLWLQGCHLNHIKLGHPWCASCICTEWRIASIAAVLIWQANHI